MNTSRPEIGSLVDRSAQLRLTERHRTDIQALRGLAILLVLLHHAHLLPGLKAGYLGVDVFFVVSGYLITGIIQRAMLSGTFTFTGFYFRRAKRLLPAAYVTFAVTAMLAPLFLTRPEMRDFAWQLLGAVTFTGNIALWLQTGYFEGAANLKPLLHVWSLSIEEQYYLLLPAALAFTPRRFWALGALVVFSASLYKCFALLPANPAATFYLLPTRAWELALGSLGTLAFEGRVAGAWLARLFWPALAALLLVPFFPTNPAHPGLDALIVCIATLVVILRAHPALNRGFAVRGLAHLGDISYSLYLVHWPLFAFANNAWVTPVPYVVRLALAILALALSWALYRWVEDPIRKAAIVVNRKSVAVILSASSVLVLAGFGANHFQSWGSPVDYAHVRRANTGLDAACETGEGLFKPKPECRSSENPRIMVWGDSYAMHLVEGLVSAGGAGVIQATKSTCGPMLGIAFFESLEGTGWYSRQWADTCIRSNQAVLEHLAAAPSVEVVVLSSQFSQYLSGKRLRALPGVDVDGGEAVAARSLIATVAAVRSLGKRVVVVAPPPQADFDVGRCLELKANGKTIFGTDKPSCGIAEARYRLANSEVRSLLDRVAREADVPVIRFDDVLCQAGVCATELKGTMLYRDQGHLSVDGSALLGREMGLTAKLLAAAR